MLSGARQDLLEDLRAIDPSWRHHTRTRRPTPREDVPDGRHELRAICNAESIGVISKSGDRRGDRRRFDYEAFVELERVERCRKVRNAMRNDHDVRVL
jgi:hypothetical protein